MSDSRWAQFTDEELGELWDAMSMDDGLRYEISEVFEPTLYKLACELTAEARVRGLELPIF